MTCSSVIFGWGLAIFSTFTHDMYLTIVSQSAVRIGALAVRIGALAGRCLLHLSKLATESWMPYLLQVRDSLPKSLKLLLLCAVVEINLDPIRGGHCP